MQTQPPFRTSCTPCTPAGRRRSHRRHAGLVPCLVAATLCLFASRLVAEDIWQTLHVGGPQSKLSPFADHSAADHPWRLGIGGGHLWFEGDSRLDDAPLVEVRLGRRFGERRPYEVDIFLSHAQTRLSRPWHFVGMGEFETPNPDIPEGEPITVESERLFTGRRRVDGRLWQLGVGLSPVWLARRVGEVQFELLARGSVFATWADFSHDRGYGAGISGALLARTRVHRRFAIDAALAVHYADYAVDGLGCTLAGLATLTGTWFF